MVRGPWHLMQSHPDTALAPTAPFSRSWVGGIEGVLRFWGVVFGGSPGVFVGDLAKIVGI